ncbi:forkhead associated domain-containing protein [Apiospora hydei]|uniref:Forkhead associated domain-containing protein n=1 Tax=Apiospora hydei TaxID=1337664 RepID=A0ABR1VIY5_9PEZI
MASDSDSQSVADDARGLHSSIPARRIALRHNIPERIGRASKVATKGFVATPDNAWFDSPVMSRTHAELIAHLDTKTLFIKDIGSLHGTFVAKKDTPTLEKRLTEHDSAELVSGDKIRFGIEILRGRDTFPPCEVDVTMEWPNSDVSLPERAPSTNHFTVPDAEDDDMLSDGGSVMVMDREDFTLPDISQPDQSTVVDLTQEADPNTSGRTRHGLTSEGLFTTESSSDVIDLTSEIDEDDRSSSPIHGYSPEPSTWPNQPTSPAMSGRDHQDTQETHDLGHAQDSNVSVTASKNQSSETPAGSGEPHNPPAVISDLVAQHTYTLQDFGGSMPLPTYLESSEDDDDEDDSMSDVLEQRESDIGSEEGDMESQWSSDDNEELDEHTNSDDSEGEDASDPDEPCNEDILSSSDDESDVIETSIFDKTSTSTQSPKSSPVAVSTKPAPKLNPLYPVRSFNALCNLGVTGEPMQATAPPNVLTNLVAIARQPSPSDAAMVKKPAASGTKQEGGKTTAQVLGEKTGKFEYFAARDQNRETVQATPSQLVAPTQYMADHVMQNTNQEGNALKSSFKVDGYSSIRGSSPPSEHVNNTQGRYHQDSDAASKAPWRSLSFLQHPIEPPVKRSRPRSKTIVSGLPPKSRAAQRPRSLSQYYAPPIWATSSSSHGHISPDPEKRTRLQSPEHDMTSAFTFERSKAAAAAKSSNEIKVIRHARRMTIPDLLAEDLEKASSPLYSPPSPVEVSPEPVTAPSMPATSRATKRTYDEVFTLDDSEDDDSESNSVDSKSPRLGFAPDTPSLSRLSATKDASTSAPALKPSVALQETNGTQVQVAARSAEAPPAKRRRLADFAACALGGAIGGQLFLLV